MQTVCSTFVLDYINTRQFLYVELDSCVALRAPSVYGGEDPLLPSPLSSTPSQPVDVSGKMYAETKFYENFFGGVPPLTPPSNPLWRPAAVVAAWGPHTDKSGLFIQIYNLDYKRSSVSQPNTHLYLRTISK